MGPTHRLVARRVSENRRFWDGSARDYREEATDEALLLLAGEVRVDCSEEAAERTLEWASKAGADRCNPRPIKVWKLDEETGRVIS